MSMERGAHVENPDRTKCTRKKVQNEWLVAQKLKSSLDKTVNLNNEWILHHQQVATLVSLAPGIYESHSALSSVGVPW